MHQLQITFKLHLNTKVGSEIYIGKYCLEGKLSYYNKTVSLF